MRKLNLIITGFLGSGKTTFVINSLLKKYRDRKMAVVVNDFGEVSYDKVLFYKDAFQVIGIEGRCICCGGIGEMIEVLNKASDAEMLILETSGLSDPYTIREALEMAGFIPYTVVCILSGNDWKEYSRESLFLSQIENSDCVVISKCDLLSFKDLGDIDSLLDGKPYFFSYSGEVEEDFFFFLEAGKIGTKKSPIRSKESEGKKERFSQITINLDAFYSMHDIETFLRNLPKNILRVKGFLRVVESPLPMGINWTRNHLSWEPIDMPVDSFLTFIGYKTFVLPPLPKPEKLTDWSRVIPLGEFDKREGIAYMFGRIVDEISVVEKLLNISFDEALMITTRESWECPFDTKGKYEINLTFEDLYYIVKVLGDNLEYENILLWDIPDAFASYLIEKLKDRNFIHIGRHYLLPKSMISLRINTRDKLQVLRELTFNKNTL